MIGIICAGQIELSPFVKKYIAVLEQESVSYEIIHWNRSGKKAADDDKNHTFSLPLDRYQSLAGKFIPFYRFRKFVKKTLKTQKYDKLIILTTQTAIMMPFSALLKYKNKYFFDYRDTSYEYLKPYKAFIDHIIKSSAYTCISSPGFAEYLTNSKELIVAHNFQDSYYAERSLACRKSTGGKVIIGYIGYLREYEYIKKLVSAFGSDERFEFRIHGSGDCVDELRRYAEQFDNVKVRGAYEEKDKMDIVASFDMICYNYPKSFVNYPAVANKFYDGMIQKKPMFGNLDTFSGKLVQDNGLGISLHENDSSIPDKIYSYYSSFDEKKFEENCELFLQKVIEDDKYYIEKIRDFVIS